ncbi:hypothetical protein EWF20_12985 [Sulfolobus sp. S-194]|uniref:hypothetical protein n=1 Tax=Sulfolobus sp. S-194 TaxID=2512240 RepID=UPI0014372525|nr:hypothetical protein [Sulfolobus sp. S-194]QIW24951.1 hypothetical protein EWF20_12985 [Sulfolobus sp. S-194]
MSENVKPIYARGFFNMNHLGETTQLTIFYYDDDEHYYASLTKEEVKRELSNLKNNMQYFLDQEIIRINGKRVKAKVLFVRLGLLKINIPYIEFIIRFKGNLHKGENVYEDLYKEEIVEYPYEAIWILPGKIVSYSISGKVKTKNNILFLKVKKGTRISGNEKIKFVI